MYSFCARGSIFHYSWFQSTFYIRVVSTRTLILMVYVNPFLLLRFNTWHLLSVPKEAASLLALQKRAISRTDSQAKEKKRTMVSALNSLHKKCDPHSVFIMQTKCVLVLVVLYESSARYISVVAQDKNTCAVFSATSQIFYLALLHLHFEAHPTA